MQVHRSNLIIALTEYIKWREEKESLQGYTGHSTFLAGIEELLSAVEKGEGIEFFPE